MISINTKSNNKREIIETIAIAMGGNKQYPFEKDGINFVLTIPDSWSYSNYTGVKLYFLDEDNNYVQVWRRIEFKNGEFDENKLIQKFTELLELKRQSEENYQKKLNKQQEKEKIYKEITSIVPVGDMHGINVQISDYGNIAIRFNVNDKEIAKTAINLLTSL